MKNETKEGENVVSLFLFLSLSLSLLHARARGGEKEVNAKAQQPTGLDNVFKVSTIFDLESSSCAVHSELLACCVEAAAKEEDNVGLVLFL